ncbi:MAG TPA: SCO family protein [Candidatus Baltobacteraceae bacterium]|nr:SCO family protein [Candidatus Baltobacteraceae bacterium]
MSSRRALVIALLLAAALAIGLEVERDLREMHGRPALRGTPLVPVRTLASTLLIDQNGRPALLPGTGAGATLVFFGYANCTDACPVGLATLAHVDRLLHAPAPLRIVFITVDPARDSPAALAKYTRSFDARIVALTGSSSQLAGVWSTFGVSIEPDSNEIAHGDSIYLMDPQGEILVEYPPDGPPADIAADARSLLSS